MRDVTHAKELVHRFVLFDLSFALIAGKIQPANDSREPIKFFTKSQHPIVFFDVMLRLHEHGLFNALRFEMRLKVGGQKRLADRFVFVRFLP